MSQERVDNRLSVETPEGVEFELELAGMMTRAGAYTIDLVLRMMAFWALATGLVYLGGFGEGLMLVVAFALTWVYAPLFELYYHGQTPGKKIFGIRVVNRDGTPVGWYGAIIRNLLRVVDMLPVGYAAAGVTMVASGRFQRLGDLAGDTVVVYVREAFVQAERRELPPAEPVQIPLSLSPKEQEAIVNFAERSVILGADRSAELAGILMPVVDGATAPETARKLHGMAHRIVKWG